MKGICIVSPHPDDELLGAGGTLIRSARSRVPVYWIIVTTMKEEDGFTRAQIESREAEVNKIADLLPFSRTISLGFPAAGLDRVQECELVDAIKHVLFDWHPDTVIVPWRNDAHTDHEKVYDAALSATKAFRAPFVRTILAMEILSETNFARGPGFTPSWYVDITGYLERKIELLLMFRSEFLPHPFPRSVESIRALATLRGSEVGVEAAEAFMLIRHTDVQ
jgi:LmbE family N-acetylglucosaminyl deacetylase